MREGREEGEKNKNDLGKEREKAETEGEYKKQQKL